MEFLTCRENRHSLYLLSFKLKVLTHTFHFENGDRKRENGRENQKREDIASRNNLRVLPTQVNASNAQRNQSNQNSGVWSREMYIAGPCKESG